MGGWGRSPPTSQKFTYLTPPPLEKSPNPVDSLRPPNSNSSLTKSQFPARLPRLHPHTKQQFSSHNPIKTAF